MPMGINLAGGDLPIVERLRLLARGAKIPAQPIVEEAAATITELVDALKQSADGHKYAGRMFAALLAASASRTAFNDERDARDILAKVRSQQ